MKNIIAAVILGVSIIAAALIHGRVAPPPADVDAQLETVRANVDKLYEYVCTLAEVPVGTFVAKWTPAWTANRQLIPEHEIEEALPADRE